MKIKCPACSKVLNIPESAAGKVVKCPCGKQLRAPGGGSPAAPKAAAPGAGAAKPAAKAAPKQPAAPVGGMGGFDADMLDELTEQDLQPVKTAKKSGGAPPAANKASGEAALQRYASQGDRRGEALIHQGLAPRPPFLMVIGGMNLLVGGFVLLGALLLGGLIAMIPMMEEEVDAEAGAVLGIIIGTMILYAILCFATTVACWVRSRICWYILAFSYSYGFAARVFDIISDVMVDEGGVRFVRAIGGILVGLGLWAYVHGEEVRAFHAAEEEPTGKVIGVNVAGFLIGCIIGGVVLFMMLQDGGVPVEEMIPPEEAMPADGGVPADVPTEEAVPAE